MNLTEVFILVLILSVIIIVYLEVRLRDIIKISIEIKMQEAMVSLLDEFKKLVPAFNNYLALSNKLIAIEENYKNLFEKMQEASREEKK